MKKEKEVKALVQDLVEKYNYNDMHVSNPQVPEPLSLETKESVDKLVAFIKLNY